MSIINMKLKPLPVMIAKVIPALTLVTVLSHSTAMAGIVNNSPVINASVDIDLDMYSGLIGSPVTFIFTQDNAITARNGLNVFEGTENTVAGIYTDTGYGLYANTGGGITIESNIVIGTGVSTTDDGSTVISVSPSGSIGNASIFADGLNSSVILKKGATISSYGTSGIGIKAMNGGSIDLMGVSNILSDGISIQAGNSSSITLSNNNSITSTTNSVIDVFGDSNVSVTNGKLITKGNDVSAVQTNGANSFVNLTNVTLNTEGLSSNVFAIENQGSINLNNSIVTTKASDATSTLVLLNNTASVNSGVFNANQSQLTTDGDVGIFAEGGNWTIKLDDSSSLTAGQAAFYLYGDTTPAIVNADILNGSKVTGALFVDPAAHTDSKLTMRLDQSTLTGKAVGQDQIDLIMNNGSSWNMTESSQINSLAFLNGLNKVYFSAPSGNAYKILTTNSLSGNGVFYINTYLNEGGANTKSDLIHVTGDASGSHTLYVNKSGSGAYTEDSNGNNVGIKVVQIDGLSTSQFALGNEVSIGIYDYYLHEGLPSDPTDQNWYLRNEIPDPPKKPDGNDNNGNGGNNPNPGPDVVGPITKPAPAPYRKEVPGYIISPMVNLLYGYQTVGTLHERMGDTQQFARGYDHKTWGRYGGQHLESKAGRFNYDIDMMFAQFGRDLYQQETESGTAVTAGATVTLGRTQTDARDKVRAYVKDSIYTGGITTNAYSVGGYYTRYAQDGGYIDAVTQFTYYDTHYHSRYDAHQKSYGLLLSLEGGKPYEVTKNWKIEPQGQIAYQFIKSEDFSDQLSEISGDNNNSGLARAGLRFFRDRAEDKTNETFKPYLTLDAVSLLSKAPSVNMGGTNVRPDFDTSWWQAGAGITTNVEKNTSFYLDVKYQKSFEGDLDGYSAHIGVQARF